MGIDILKPDINESETRFTVKDNKIRFGLGTVKNVGIGAVDAIVEERNKNGKYLGFTDFCERIKNESVNKKCIESLIKAGAFDSLGMTRATLLASFERIVDTINSSGKNVMENQVSMFDIISEEEEVPESQKYSFDEKPEMDMKELLFLEKEMLGIYISGHPLDKYREKIETRTNVSSLDFINANQELETTGNIKNLKDNQEVLYAGIISKIKKKYTKKNTIMAGILASLISKKRVKKA